MLQKYAATVAGTHQEEWTPKSVQERLTLKCATKFGVPHMEINQCYELLTSVINLESSGVPSCYPSGTVPTTNHSPEYFSECGQVERLIAQYALPVLQIFCLFGNVMNLLIYRLPYFHGSSAVYFLRAKALANLLFVESRSFEVLHAWLFVPNDQFEELYWKSRPYIITVANISASSAMHFIFLSTHQVSSKLSLYSPPPPAISMLSGSAGRHYYAPLHQFRQHHHQPHNTDQPKQVSNCWELIITYSMQPIAVLLTNQSYEKIYYWLQMLCSIVVPTLAMLLCSVLIVTRFTFKELGEAFSQRRKCVIRMTCATTLSHLMLEGPALLTFGAVALKGASSQHHNANICIINNTNNLLSVINATIPFFVFVLCNQQFRKMSSVYLSNNKSADTRSDSQKRNNNKMHPAMDESNRSIHRNAPFTPTLQVVTECSKPSTPILIHSASDKLVNGDEVSIIL
uniref:G-protein coupled receptors family 1 profile domain-containing protein n=1 Tax=Ditylenchus dipsaci TaxID=166011 RepID=A0A915DWU6_9BILA